MPRCTTGPGGGTGGTSGTTGTLVPEAGVGPGPCPWLRSESGGASGNETLSEARGAAGSADRWTTAPSPAVGTESAPASVACGPSRSTTGSTGAAGAMGPGSSSGTGAGTATSSRTGTSGRSATVKGRGGAGIDGTDGTRMTVTGADDAGTGGETNVRWSGARGSGTDRPPPSAEPGPGAEAGSKDGAGADAGPGAGDTVRETVGTPEPPVPVNSPPSPPCSVKDAATARTGPSSCTGTPADGTGTSLPSYRRTPVSALRGTPAAPRPSTAFGASKVRGPGCCPVRCTLGAARPCPVPAGACALTRCPRGPVMVGSCQLPSRCRNPTGSVISPTSPPSVRWTGGADRHPGSGSAPETASVPEAARGSGPGSDGPGRLSPSASRLPLSQDSSPISDSPLPLVEPGDLLDVPLSFAVFQIEQFVERPVEVISEVRDLLVEALGRVRHDSPRRPPARSTAKCSWQEGQVTAARVCPSALIRR